MQDLCVGEPRLGVCPLRQEDPADGVRPAQAQDIRGFRPHQHRGDQLLPGQQEPPGAGDQTLGNRPPRHPHGRPHPAQPR